MSQSELFEISPEDAARIEAAAKTLTESRVQQDPHKWPRTLAAMVDILVSLFRTEGIPNDQAIALATKGVIALARYEGGRFHYLPTTESLETATRDRAMFQRWMRGLATPDQLAADTGLGYVRVMQIIAEQRRLWRQAHEPGLPGL